MRQLKGRQIRRKSMNDYIIKASYFGKYQRKNLLVTNDQYIFSLLSALNKDTDLLT